MGHHRIKTVYSLVSLLLAGMAGQAAEWPAYRHDIGRSAITADQPALPLRLVWRYMAPQPPRPAWPAPLRPPQQMDFDYAPAPVIANGLLYFGSTADDTIRALDAVTGREKWHFITGGPVRFAPQIEGDRLYAASDDGYVYCLGAEDGRLIWSLRAAPSDERLIGNRRMISRWPIRTGVMVEGGVVNCVAGIWSSEGVYVYALKADTGEVIWCNDTGHITGQSVGTGWRPNDPHGGEFSMTGLTPQGALLGTTNTLVVPLANNCPAQFSRLTGELTAYASNSRGGTWATIDGDMFYTYDISGKLPRPLTLFGRVLRPSTGTRGRVHRFPQEQIPDVWDAKESDRLVQQQLGKLSVIVENGKLIARNAYGLIKAGELLFVGQDGFVIATAVDMEKELWRADVDGRARELAVANGRLYVAAESGEISCFEAAATAVSPKVTVHKQASAVAVGSVASTGIFTAGIRRAGMTHGYALVLGDAGADVIKELVQQTDLHLINLLADSESVARQREHWLTNTPWYGSRVTVEQLAASGRLPFAQMFANVIILTDMGADFAPAALFRLLRPYGGLMVATSSRFGNLKKWLISGGVPIAEIAVGDGGASSITRGPLPGARDWFNAEQQDQRVHWPMRSLWYGGPESALTMYSGIGQHPPVAANGRYFVMGDETLSAVDAYNGTVLWTRPLPPVWTNVRVVDGFRHVIADNPVARMPKKLNMFNLMDSPRKLGADASHVFLSLADHYFGGRGDSCIKLDARTGEQLAMVAPWQPSELIDAAQPRTWSLEVDSRHKGTLTMQTSVDGLSLSLTTIDPAVTRLDGWDLSFDFRPWERRYGLYERGVFQIRVTPTLDTGTPPAWCFYRGTPAPVPVIAGEISGGGTHTKFYLPWSAIEKSLGSLPETFGFAATLNSHDGGEREPIGQAYLFSDAATPGLNNGWATVLRSGIAKNVDKAPAVVLGDWSAMPGDWVIALEDPPSINEQIRTDLRVHPLTGELEEKIYRSGSGACGMPVFSKSTLFSRSTKQALAIYDFADDSGLRFFGGIAANCGQAFKWNNMNVALGLVIFSEGRSHCDCMTPIKTSLALATVEKRSNEDWAIYFDKRVDRQIRQAAVNFGALGDRRDDQGTLWLGYPRPAAPEVYPWEAGTRHIVINHPPIDGLLQLPLTVERLASGMISRAYRENADAIMIEGTSRPWLYASGYRGLQRATLQLEFSKVLVSMPIAEAPGLDGEVQAGEWGERLASLPVTQTDVYLRHDSDHLYIAAKRPIAVNHLGQPYAWTKKVTIRDEDVFADDSWEVFLGDARDRCVVHLAVSASGARFDALGTKKTEDCSWDGGWRSAVVADDQHFMVEMEIPWQTLENAGLQREKLRFNCQMNQVALNKAAPTYPGWQQQVREGVNFEEPLVRLGVEGRARCRNFYPLGLGKKPELEPRQFTVRLHFAELDESVLPGTRVFDVKLQGQTVLDRFDVVKEAGGPRKALVKEFCSISALRDLTLEFIPAEKPLSVKTSPIISALEIKEEGFASPGLLAKGVGGNE